MVLSETAKGYFLGMAVSIFGIVILALTTLDVGIKADIQNIVSSDRSLAILKTPDQIVLEELTIKKATYDNSTNITNIGVGFHDSFAVQPDPVLKYRLRPDISISAYILTPREKMNFDMPVIYIDDKKAPYSEGVNEYLRSQQLTEYHITSDSSGFRTTLPAVSAADKVLVVGDSVAFGLGVDDRDTLPSQMQQISGHDLQIVNAALSGYSTTNNIATIEKYKARGYRHLVYVICANDLHGDFKSSVREIIDKLSVYRSNFESVTVVLHSFLEETGASVFQPEKRTSIDEYSKELNQEITGYAEDLDIGFIDWYQLVKRFEKNAKTPFSVFGLYVDHCHFSKAGNKMLAKVVMSDIRLRSARNSRH